MAKQLGDTRTFEKFGGKWKITNIDDKVSKKYEVITQKPEVVCPKCGEKYYAKKTYNIVYVETLENNEKTMHLGISDKNNYIILEEGKEVTNGN